MKTEIYKAKNAYPHMDGTGLFAREAHWKISLYSIGKPDPVHWAHFWSTFCLSVAVPKIRHNFGLFFPYHPPPQP